MEQKDFVEVSLESKDITSVVSENGSTADANTESFAESRTDAETVEYVFGQSDDKEFLAEKEEKRSKKAKKSGDAKKRRNWRVGIISFLSAIVIAALACGLFFHFQTSDVEDEPTVTKVSIFEKKLSEYKLAGNYVLTKEDFDCIGTDIGKMELNGEVCIDLNGKTLDLGGYDFSVFANDDGATVTFKNGTVKNGTLNVTTKNTKIIRENVRFDSTCVCNFSKYSIFQTRQDEYVLPAGKTYILDEDDYAYIKDASKDNAMLLSYPCTINVNGGRFDLGGYEFDIVSKESSSKLVAFENGTITNGKLRVTTEATDVKVDGISFTDTCDYHFDTKKATVSFVSLAQPLSTDKFTIVGGTIRLSNTVIPDTLVLKSNFIAENNSSVKGLLVTNEESEEEKISIAISDTTVYDKLTIQKNVDFAGVIDCPVTIEEKATLNVLKNTASITGEEVETGTETKIKAITVNSETATLVQANQSTIESLFVEKAGTVTLGGKVNSLAVNDKATVNVRNCSIVDEVKINDNAKVEIKGTASKVEINSESTVSFTTGSYVQDLTVTEKAEKSKVSVNGQAAVIVVESKTSTLEVKGDAKVSVVVDKTENEISKIVYAEKAEVTEKLTSDAESLDEKQDQAKKDFIMPIYYKESECSDGSEEQEESKKGAIIYKEGGEYTAEGQTSEEEVAAKEHVYTYSIVSYPTASKVGLGRYTCVDCGEHYDEEIPMREVVVFNIESIMQLLGVVLEDDKYTYNLDDNTKFVLEYQQINEILEGIHSFLEGETAQTIALNMGWESQVETWKETLQQAMLAEDECALFLIREAGINLTVLDGKVYGNACLDLALFNGLAASSLADLTSLKNDDAFVSIYIKLVCKGEKAYLKYDFKILNKEGEEVFCKKSENIGEVQKAIDKLMTDSGLGFTLTDVIGLYNTVAETVGIIDSYKLSFEKYKDYLVDSLAKFVITKDPDFVVKEETETQTKVIVDFEKFAQYLTKIGGTTLGGLIDESLGEDATDTLFSLAEKLPEKTLGEIVDTVMLAANEFAIDEETLYGDINVIIELFVNDVPYDVIEKGLAAKVAANAQEYFGKKAEEDGAEYDIRRALDKYENSTVYELIFGFAPVYDYNDEMKAIYATEKDYYIYFYGSEEYKEYYEKKVEILGGNKNVEGQVVTVKGKYQEVLDTYKVSMNTSVKAIFDDVYTTVREVMVAFEDISGDYLADLLERRGSEEMQSIFEPIIETVGPTLSTITTFISEVGQMMPDYQDEQGNVNAYENVAQLITNYTDNLTCSWVKEDKEFVAFTFGADFDSFTFGITVEGEDVDVDLSTEYGAINVSVGDVIIVGFDSEKFGAEVAFTEEGFKSFELKKFDCEYFDVALLVSEGMLKELTVENVAYDQFTGGFSIIDNVLVSASFGCDYGSFDYTGNEETIIKLDANAEVLGITAVLAVENNVLKSLTLNGNPATFTMDDKEWNIDANVVTTEGANVALTLGGLNTFEKVDGNVVYTRTSTSSEEIESKTYITTVKNEYVLNVNYEVDANLDMGLTKTVSTDVVYANKDTEAEYKEKDDENAKSEEEVSFINAFRKVEDGEITSEINVDYGAITLAATFDRKVDGKLSADGDFKISDQEILYIYNKDREDVVSNITYKIWRDATEEERTELEKDMKEEDKGKELKVADTYTIDILGDDTKTATTVTVDAIVVTYEDYVDGGVSYTVVYGEDITVQYANYVEPVEEIVQLVNVVLPIGTAYYSKDENDTYIVNFNAFDVELEAQYGKEIVFNVLYSDMIDLEFAKGEEDMVGHLILAGGQVDLSVEQGDELKIDLAVMTDNTVTYYSEEEDFTVYVDVMGYSVAVEYLSEKLDVEIYDQNNNTFTFMKNGEEYYTDFVLEGKMEFEGKYGTEILADLTVDNFGSVYYDKIGDKVKAEIIYKDSIECKYDNGAHDINLIAEGLAELHYFHSGEILTVETEVMDTIFVNVNKTEAKTVADLTFRSGEIVIQGLYEETKSGETTNAQGSLVWSGAIDFEYNKVGAKTVYSLAVLDSTKPFVTVTDDDGDMDYLVELGNIYMDGEKGFEDITFEYFTGKERKFISYITGTTKAIKVTKELQEDYNGYIVEYDAEKWTIHKNFIEDTLLLEYNVEESGILFHYEEEPAKKYVHTIVNNNDIAVTVTRDLAEDKVDNVVITAELLEKAIITSYNYKEEKFILVGNKKNWEVGDKIIAEASAEISYIAGDIDIDVFASQTIDFTFNKAGEEYTVALDVSEGKYTFDFEYTEDILKVDTYLDAGNYNAYYYDTEEGLLFGAKVQDFVAKFSLIDDVYTVTVDYGTILDIDATYDEENGHNIDAVYYKKETDHDQDVKATFKFRQSDLIIRFTFDRYLWNSGDSTMSETQIFAEYTDENWFQFDILCDRAIEDRNDFVADEYINIWVKKNEFKFIVELPEEQFYAAVKFYDTDLYKDFWEKVKEKEWFKLIQDLGKVRDIETATVFITDLLNFVYEIFIEDLTMEKLFENFLNCGIESYEFGFGYIRYYDEDVVKPTIVKLTYDSEACTFGISFSDSEDESGVFILTIDYSAYTKKPNGRYNGVVRCYLTSKIYYNDGEDIYYEELEAEGFSFTFENILDEATEEVTGVNIYGEVNFLWDYYIVLVWDYASEEFSLQYWSPCTYGEETINELEGTITFRLTGDGQFSYIIARNSLRGISPYEQEMIDIEHFEYDNGNINFFERSYTDLNDGKKEEEKSADNVYYRDDWKMTYDKDTEVLKVYLYDNTYSNEATGVNTNLYINNKAYSVSYLSGYMEYGNDTEKSTDTKKVKYFDIYDYCSNTDSTGFTAFSKNYPYSMFKEERLAEDPTATVTLNDYTDYYNNLVLTEGLGSTYRYSFQKHYTYQQYREDRYEFSHSAWFMYDRYNGGSEEIQTKRNKPVTVKYGTDNVLGILHEGSLDTSKIYRASGEEEDVEMTQETIDAFDAFAEEFVEYQEYIDNAKTGICSISDVNEMRAYDRAGDALINLYRYHNYLTMSCNDTNNSQVIYLTKTLLKYRSGAYTGSAYASEMKKLASIFGYADAESFLTNVQALITELDANNAGVSTETVSDRCRVDGAVYTSNGTYVFPYIVRGGTYETPIVLVVYQFRNTTQAAVWVNVPDSLQSIVGNYAIDKYTLYGREQLFEDGKGYDYFDYVDYVTDYIKKGYGTLDYEAYESANYSNILRCVGKTYNTVTVDEKHIDIQSCNENIFAIYDKDNVDSIIDNTTYKTITASTASRVDTIDYNYEYLWQTGGTALNIANLEENARYTGGNFNGVGSFASTLCNIDYLMADSFDVSMFSQYTLIGLSKKFLLSSESEEDLLDNEIYYDAIAALFGYEDEDTFFEVAQDLAQTLSTNPAEASVFNRLAYKGGIYALQNDYRYTEGTIIFPYCIKDETFGTELYIVLLYKKGLLTAYVNDANRLVEMVNPADNEHFDVETDDNVVITLEGRCLMTDLRDTQVWLNFVDEYCAKIEDTFTFEEYDRYVHIDIIAEGKETTYNVYGESYRNKREGVRVDDGGLFLSLVLYSNDEGYLNGAKYSMVEGVWVSDDPFTEEEDALEFPFIIRMDKDLWQFGVLRHYADDENEYMFSATVIPTLDTEEWTGTFDIHLSTGFMTSEKVGYDKLKAKDIYSYTRHDFDFEGEGTLSKLENGQKGRNINIVLNNIEMFDLTVALPDDENKNHGIAVMVNTFNIDEKDASKLVYTERNFALFAEVPSEKENIVTVSYDTYDFTAHTKWDDEDRFINLYLEKEKKDYIFAETHFIVPDTDKDYFEIKVRIPEMGEEAGITATVVDVMGRYVEEDKNFILDASMYNPNVDEKGKNLSWQYKMTTTDLNTSGDAQKITTNVIELEKVMKAHVEVKADTENKAFRLAYKVDPFKYVAYETTEKPLEEKEEDKFIENSRETMEYTQPIEKETSISIDLKGVSRYYTKTGATDGSYVEYKEGKLSSKEQTTAIETYEEYVVSMPTDENGNKVSVSVKKGAVSETTVTAVIEEDGTHTDNKKVVTTSKGMDISAEVVLPTEDKKYLEVNASIGEMEDFTQDSTTYEDITKEEALGSASLTKHGAGTAQLIYDNTTDGKYVLKATTGGTSYGTEERAEGKVVSGTEKALTATSAQVSIDTSVEKRIELSANFSGTTYAETVYGAEKADGTTKNTYSVSNINGDVTFDNSVENVVDFKASVSGFDITQENFEYDTEKKDLASVTKTEKKLSKVADGTSGTTITAEVKYDHATETKYELFGDLCGFIYQDIATEGESTEESSYMLTRVYADLVVNVPADKEVENKYKLFFTVKPFSYTTIGADKKKDVVSFNGFETNDFVQLGNEKDNTYGYSVTVTALDTATENITFKMAYESNPDSNKEWTSKGYTSYLFVTIPVKAEDGYFEDGKNVFKKWGVSDSIPDDTIEITLPTATDKLYRLNVTKFVPEEVKEGEVAPKTPVYKAVTTMDYILHIPTEENNYVQVKLYSKDAKIGSDIDVDIQVVDEIEKEGTFSFSLDKDGHNFVTVAWTQPATCEDEEGEAEEKDIEYTLFVTTEVEKVDADAQQGEEEEQEPVYEEVTLLKFTHHIPTEVKGKNYFDIDFAIQDWTLVNIPDFSFDVTLDMNTEGRYYLNGHINKALVGSVEVIVPTEDRQEYALTVMKGVEKTEEGTPISNDGKEKEPEYVEEEVLYVSVLLPVEDNNFYQGALRINGKKIGTAVVTAPNDKKTEYGLNIFKTVEKQEGEKTTYVDEEIFDIFYHEASDEEDYYEARLFVTDFVFGNVNFGGVEFTYGKEEAKKGKAYKAVLTYADALIGTAIEYVPTADAYEFGLTLNKGVEKTDGEKVTYEEELIFDIFYHEASDEEDYYVLKLNVPEFVIDAESGKKFAGIYFSADKAEEEVKHGKAYKASLEYAGALLGSVVVTIPTAEDKEYGLIINQAVKKEEGEKVTYEEKTMLDISFHLATGFEGLNYYDAKVFVAEMTEGEGEGAKTYPEIKASAVLFVPMEGYEKYALDVDYNGKKIVSGSLSTAYALNAEIMDAQYKLHFDRDDNILFSFTNPTDVYVIDRAFASDLEKTAGEHSASGHAYFTWSENKTEGKELIKVGFAYEYKDLYDEDGFVRNEKTFDVCALHNGNGLVLDAGSKTDFEPDTKVVEEVDAFFAEIEKK